MGYTDITSQKILDGRESVVMPHPPTHREAEKTVMDDDDDDKEDTPKPQETGFVVAEDTDSEF